MKGQYAEPEQHTWQIGQVPRRTLVEHQNAADYPLRQADLIWTNRLRSARYEASHLRARSLKPNL